MIFSESEKDSLVQEKTRKSSLDEYRSNKYCSEQVDPIIKRQMSMPHLTKSCVEHFNHTKFDRLQQEQNESQKILLIKKMINTLLKQGQVNRQYYVNEISVIKKRIERIVQMNEKSKREIEYYSKLNMQKYIIELIQQQEAVIKDYQKSIKSFQSEITSIQFEMSLLIQQREKLSHRAMKMLNKNRTLQILAKQI